MSKDLVIVVDDDADVRDSIRTLLGSAGLRVQCYASARRVLEEPIPSHACLVTDIRMPDMSGLELQEHLAQCAVNLPAIIITGHGDVPLAVRAMKAGALDFIEKPVDGEVLLASVRRALDVGSQVHGRKTQLQAARTSLDQLTPRERDVLNLLVEGKPNKVVAQELGISPRTVELHRARLSEKLGASSLSTLVRIVMAAGDQA